MEINHSYYQGLSKEDLLFLIGESLQQEHRHAFPPNPQNFKKIGERWLKENMEKIRDVVCSSPKIKSLINSDIAILASAIGDLVVGIFTGIAPMTVAYLIIKTGLDQFCKNFAVK